MNATRETPSRATTYVGVDVGATKTAVAVGTADGKLAGKRVLPTLLGDPAGLADSVAATIDELHEDLGTIPASPVGIGICGGVDREGLVHGPIALGWPGRVDFAGLVAQRTGAPTSIDNDVNAGAVGEHWWGAGRGVDDFMYLALGTGIGAGLVLGGSLYRGSRSLAGEIGHLSVDIRGVNCACGNRGCIEASCGGKAVAELLVERLRRDGGVATTLRDTLRVSGSITTRDLFEHALAGDAFSQHEVDRIALHLAAAIVGVVNLLDLTLVLVGGGMVQNGVLLPAIQRALTTTRPYLNRDPGLLVPAGLGEDAGVTGALAIAVEAYAPPQADRHAVDGGRVM
jgi:glucokinase